MIHQLPNKQVSTVVHPLSFYQTHAECPTFRGFRGWKRGFHEPIPPNLFHHHFPVRPITNLRAAVEERPFRAASFARLDEAFRPRGCSLG